MKTIRLLIILLVLSVLMTLFYLIQTEVIRFPWEPERTTTVYTELIESSESSLLQTAEFSLKLIFPYDFIEEGDDAEWQYLKRQFDKFPDDYARRGSEEFYNDRTLPAKWKYASLYALCRSCGIDPAGRTENFIVVSTKTRAGFDFNEDSISFDSDESGENIVLTLPGPEITAIIIEDRIPEDSGFPAVEMSPSQWSRFITELTPAIGELAEEAGILELAEETAAFLLADLFGGAGMTLQRIDFNYEKTE